MLCKGGCKNVGDVFCQLNLISKKGIFPRGVLDEILNLIESVSEGFPSYPNAKMRKKCKK